MESSENNQLTAFISHSWKDAFAPERVQQLFKNSLPNLECLFDRNNIELGTELTSAIDHMLGESDFVVALLTEDSLKSLAVREELTRAHERKLRIFPLVQSDQSNHLPAFLRDCFYITFSQKQDIEAKILVLAEHIKKHMASLCAERTHRLICDLHDYIQRIPYKKELFSQESEMLFAQASEAVAQCHEELQVIAEGKYKAQIGSATGFLRKCKPVFEHANHLYAVSRDDISTFWTSNSNHDAELALEYLRANPKTTIRLFVFSDALAAHSHHHILNVHHKFYGSTGAVLLTSKDEYLKLLGQSGIDSGYLDLSKDFALLSFNSNSGPMYYEASLGAGEFKVTKLGSERSVARPLKSLRDWFIHFSKLEHGSVDTTYNVMRWSLDLQNETHRYASSMKTLFDIPTHSYYHIVLFHGVEAIDELRSLLQSEISMIIDDLPYDHLVKKSLQGFWVCEGFDPRAHEPISSGRIIVKSHEWPTALIMQFSDKNAIESWQQLTEHSLLRRKAHLLFSSDIDEIYDELDQCLRFNRPDWEKAQIYEKIELFSSQYMSRIDYRDTLLTEELVTKKVPRPPIRMEPF